MPAKPGTILPPPIPGGVACPQTLTQGTVVGETYVIQEQIGQSEIARSFLATPIDQPDGEPVSLKLMHSALLDLFKSIEPSFDDAKACRHRYLSRLLGSGTHLGCPYLALEYVRGQTLRHVIERKEATHAKFSPRTALSLISPFAQALEAVHEHLPHGALTPQNVYVERNGRVCLANLGFGWLVELALHRAKQGPGADSPFIAPEVRKNPLAVTRASDVYSMGMITIALLATHYPTIANAESLSQRVLRRVPESLSHLLSSAIAADPQDRPRSPTTLLEMLYNAIEDLRDQIILERTGEISIPVLTGSAPEASAQSQGEPAPSSPGRPDALSSLLAVTDLPPAPEDGEDPIVWLLHRDGFDYGPYNSEQVREQLLNDSIDEYTQVRNLETQDGGFLGQIEDFSDFAANYIPVREERRHREALRKAEVQRKVKRASATSIITAIIGLLGLLGLYGYYLEYIRPKPQAIFFEQLFARLPNDFAPPNQSYIGITADPALMASLFNFEEEIPPTAPVRRHRPASADSTLDPALQGTEDDWDPDDLGTIDFTQSSGAQRLTADDINETIAQSAGSIQHCFQSEIATNPRFGSGGRLAIRFTIRPNGRPVGVDMEPGTYSDELRSCLVRIFRSMSFPEHNELSLPIIYPFQIRARR